MRKLRALWMRLRGMFSAGRREHELAAEMESHLQLHIEDNLRSGMTPELARREAVIKLGGVEQTKQACRDRSTLPLLENLLQDARYASRQLRKSPGFTVTAVLTLALGIGANTAIFSIMDAVVLHPLAVPNLGKVMTVVEEQGRVGYKQVALANYEDWKRQSHSFDQLAVRTYAFMSLTGAGDAAHVQAAYTSANFFKVILAQPLFGHVFQEENSQPGRDDVTVLSYGFWQKNFGSDPAVLGRKVVLDRRTYTVIGVMPKTLQYPSTADLFVPLAPTPQQLENRSAHDYLVIGRLRRGVTVKEAQAELKGIAGRFSKLYPATNVGWSVKIEPLLDDINGELTPMYFRLVLGASVFVLLVVCANVANLQFARSIARRPEIAMRTALGASHGRILRQLLTESVLLGLIGAAGGLLLAKINLHFVLISMPERVARYLAGWSNISLNSRTLILSILLAMGAGVISSLAPALEAMRVNLVDQLKAGSRTATGSRRTHRLRSIFAVAQISLAVALVVGGALMCKGMLAMLHLTDLYRPEQVLTFSVSLPHERYSSPEKMSAWYDVSLSKLRSLPGVKNAQITTTLPYSDEGAWMDDVEIEHRPLAPGKFQSAQRLAVSDGYLSAMHIPVIAGRHFNANDGLTTQPVAIVSRKFAAMYFAGQTPLGNRIRMGGARRSGDPWLTIIGIAEDATYTWTDQTPQPAMYLDAAQMPPTGATYAVLTSGNPLARTSEVRKTLAGIDPTLPLDSVLTYAQFLHDSLTGLRYVVVMLGVDALIALLLAAIGIFGVMANLVTEQTRDIGLRLILGARREDILKMILRRAALLTGAGAALGILLAAGLARLVASLLYGVRPYDLFVFAAATSVIVVIALLSSWFPARRAAFTDPMQALRSE